MMLEIQLTNDSPKLGLGLVGFMRAVLGFEKDMMADGMIRAFQAVPE